MAASCEYSNVYDNIQKIWDTIGLEQNRG